MQTEESTKERACGVVPLDVLEERMNNRVLDALGEVCTIRVFYGVTEEEFKDHQLTPMRKVEENAEIGVGKSAEGKRILLKKQKLHQ